MKAILEFQLPEDRGDFAVASKAMDWALAMWDLDQYLRDIIKYGAEFKTIGDALDEIRERLHSVMEERAINFEDIQ